MIIECQTCRARFRLDESRIKGRGARVKCRKCGDSIVVLVDGTPRPPAPGGDDSFDLGPAVRDSAAVEAAARGKDEMDLAFDRILSVPADGSIPFLREAEAGVPPERDVPASPDPRPETDLGALNLEFGPEEKLDLPPEEKLDLPPEEELDLPPQEALDLPPQEALDLPSVKEPDPPAVESAAEPPADSRGETGFLISDMDALDYLQEKHRDTVSDAPPAIGDISPEISFAPADAESAFLRAPDAPDAPREERASPLPAAAFRPEDVAPPEPPEVEAPPHAEEEPVPALPAESAEQDDSPAAESPRPRSSAMPAAAAVLAILLMAGGYLGLTASGRRTLEKAIPGAAALWGGKPSVPAPPKYDLRSVIGYYENGGASSRILVIKGQVANLSDAEKSGIRVQATLLDNADAVLAQQTVYAGNLLTGDAIRKGNRDTVSKALGNRFGEGLANMSVAPGKAIPFMVVFFEAPAAMDSYKLEAMDGE